MSTQHVTPMATMASQLYLLFVRIPTRMLGSNQRPEFFSSRNELSNHQAETQTIRMLSI